MSERLDAVQERLDAVKAEMKMKILDDPFGLWLAVPSIHYQDGNRFWSLIGQLTNQGIELQGKYHKDLPEQTLDAARRFWRNHLRPFIPSVSDAVNEGMHVFGMRVLVDTNLPCDAWEIRYD